MKEERDRARLGSPYEAVPWMVPAPSEVPTCLGPVTLATMGLRQKRARNAAARLQPAATQRTGVQEPIASSNLAAPHPAKMEATPLEV